MSVYYVESPSQLICAMESIYLTNDKAEIYIRLNGNINNDSQILKTIDYFQNNKELQFKYKTIRNIASFIFKVIPRFVFSEEEAFVGCHKSKYVKILSFFKKSCCLLDDGIATLLYLRSGGKGSLFTCLNIESNDCKVVKHQFDFLREKTSNKTYSESNIFYGAKYVEAGIISKDNYVKILSLLTKKYGHLHYIAHRAELESNIKEYNKLNLTVHRWSFPSEIEIVESSTIPKNFLGLYSAALITSKVLLPEANVISIRTSELSISKANIDAIYSIFTEHGIDVVDM